MPQMAATSSSRLVKATLLLHRTSTSRIFHRAYSAQLSPRQQDATVLLSLARNDAKLQDKFPHLGGCHFCGKFRSPSEFEHPQILGARNAYALVAGVGAITRGYSLLLPVAHVSSMAQHMHNHPHHASPFAVAEEVRSVLLGAYANSTVLIAEHGSCESESTFNDAACVSHAHLHFFTVPHELVQPILARITSELGEGRVHKSCAELQHYTDDHYHLLTTQPGVYHVWHNRRRSFMTSQLFRRVVAQELANHRREEIEFNWRVAPYASRMTQTISQLRGLWGMPWSSDHLSQSNGMSPDTVRQGQALCKGPHPQNAIPGPSQRVQDCS